MHPSKVRLVPVALLCASTLLVTVTPTQARSQAQGESQPRSGRNTTALDALEFVDSAEVVAPERASAEKPQAPRPKIETDADMAQQTSSSTNASQQKTTRPPANPTGQQDENSKRILGFIPNFQTKNDDPGNQPPLTVRQKYILALHQAVDFSAHIDNLLQAALLQAADAQPHFGQGWGAYAERFGAAEGDQATAAFFMFGFLPSILHDDPRYFRRAHGPKWMRFKYAVTRTLVTRKDTGESTFNIPVVAGLLFQQSISTIYYPPVDRTATGVFQNWGTSLAFNSAYNVMKEFYPDLIRIVFHRRQHQGSILVLEPAPAPSAKPLI
jgi:hypothetical protein